MLRITLIRNDGGGVGGVGVALKILGEEFINKISFMWFHEIFLIPVTSQSRLV